jgi:hypothetical protein
LLLLLLLLSLAAGAADNDNQHAIAFDAQSVGCCVLPSAVKIVLGMSALAVAGDCCLLLLRKGE